ncbi:MAG: LLM class flavin-dependent oxidoreductase [Pseudomonadales bacterium]|nr:LLM class flavin-dependent oxidoreductase [Pseudomonadales bacterium]
MRICTWAPTVFQGTQIVSKSTRPTHIPSGSDLATVTTGIVERYEQMGVSDLLIAQRWWGNGEEIEASSLDCLAMTSLFATCTAKMNLITAIHPGFFHPTVIAKWASTLQRLSGGRWSINVTSGWNMEEFERYGIDQLTHDERYTRSKEFIDILRLCWSQPTVDYEGQYYQCRNLELVPQPEFPLDIFQGGQSPAAVQMAAEKSDWMFLNGGSPERIEEIIEQVRSACATTGRKVRFAMYAQPLCRANDGLAWAEIDQQLASIDQQLVKRRLARVSDGATGMWNNADPLSQLDTNEGFAPQFIGSPESILERIAMYRALGVEMLHLDLRDELFCAEVLPHLSG